MALSTQGFTLPFPNGQHPYANRTLYGRNRIRVQWPALFQAMLRVVNVYLESGSTCSPPDLACTDHVWFAWFNSFRFGHPSNPPKRHKRRDWTPLPFPLVDFYFQMVILWSASSHNLLSTSWQYGSDFACIKIKRHNIYIRAWCFLPYSRYNNQPGW